MANPQVENGHTRIANELLDAIVRVGLSGDEGKAFWFIVRKTYGFQKTTDSISLTQFCLATGMNKQNVCRALSNLIKKKMVIKSDKDRITKYRIQKDYTIWTPLSKLITLSNLIKPFIESDNEIVIKSETYKRNKNTKETITKEKSMSSEIEMILLQWNDFAVNHDLSPIRSIVKSSTRGRQLLARMREPFFDFSELLKLMEKQTFLMGENKDGWTATFDWIIKQSNYMKVIEGAYLSNKNQNKYSGIADWRKEDG